MDNKEDLRKADLKILFFFCGILFFIAVIIFW